MPRPACAGLLRRRLPAGYARSAEIHSASASEFFEDGRSARPLPEGTVARGHLNDDTAFYTGKGPDGKPLDTFPFPSPKT